MSELINNAEKRKIEVQEIIRSLNTDSGDPGKRKKIEKRFAAVLKSLSPEEIAEAEQALISEGMPVEEVQQLCEIHVDAFESTLKRNAGKDKEATRLSRLSGHPIATYRAENAALRSEIRRWLTALRRYRANDPSTLAALKAAFDSVARVEVHYARKENQLFPYLESAGFTGPSKVMWGKHDEIRALLRSFRAALESGDAAECKKQAGKLARSLKRMIFMEEKILFPTSLRKLPEALWIAIRRGEAAIGYAWIKSGNLWDPNVAESTALRKNSAAAQSASQPVQQSEAGTNQAGADQLIKLSTGELTRDQLDLMLTHLPLDVSFVDEKDIVRYYSDNSDRIFPRSPGIIGRAVQNCHPPASVHVVQKIIDDFKQRKRTEATFWIQMRGKFILIQYFPLYDGERFKGVLEVSQDVTAIRALEGERRLLDDE